jgi:hypothetical protein
MKNKCEFNSNNLFCSSPLSLCDISPQGGGRLRVVVKTRWYNKPE